MKRENNPNIKPALTIILIAIILGIGVINQQQAINNVYGTIEFINYQLYSDPQLSTAPETDLIYCYDFDQGNNPGIASAVMELKLPKKVVEDFGIGHELNQRVEIRSIERSTQKPNEYTVIFDTGKTWFGTGKSSGKITLIPDIAKITETDTNNPDEPPTTTGGTTPPTTTGTNPENKESPSSGETTEEITNEETKTQVEHQEQITQETKEYLRISVSKGGTDGVKAFKGSCPQPAKHDLQGGTNQESKTEFFNFLKNNPGRLYSKVKIADENGKIYALSVRLDYTASRSW